MSEALKPVLCGCGGEPVVGHIKKTSYLPKDRWYIGCPKCDICTGLYDTESEAITAWNRAMNITHERAIDYLQSTGWMQDHDRDISSRIAPDYDTEGDPRWRVELGTKDTHDENDDR